MLLLNVFQFLLFQFANQLLGVTISAHRSPCFSMSLTLIHLILPYKAINRNGFRVRIPHLLLHLACIREKSRHEYLPHEPPASTFMENAASFSPKLINNS